ncbi:MAG: pyridoxal phosphate-dependent aminotransferase [Acidobacteriota bacterium]|nr:pyridoxal phosphate-dependent aminotransferase [Acidobacteriota bacterium]
MFSSRTTGELQPNRLTEEIRRARASGRQVIDLTVTNPTTCGFAYPPALLASLADPAAATYAPQPLGARGARDAVARDYARRGVRVHPDQVVLTASTSEAYSILFKLLCDPAGDWVLVPAPSYPLFEHLTSLDGVSAATYPLEYHGRWMVDFRALDDRWTARVRAVLAVSPNNPTGSILTPDELDRLARWCVERRTALIVDEVFADYPLTGALVPYATRSSGPLTFRLGGLSKSIGLPQVKLGWIAVDGPEPVVAEALQRLELICDTYLSVSTPVQAAAPRLLAEGAVVRDQILARVRGNDLTLRRSAERFPSVEPLSTEAGWSAVLRVPATRTEEELVLELLGRDDVLVHPGYFFDFPREAYVVLSLLPEPDVFAEGVRRLLSKWGHSPLP